MPDIIRRDLEWVLSLAASAARGDDRARLADLAASWGCPLPEEGHKHCCRCGETKPHSDFSPDKKGKFGLNAWCRECHAEHKRVVRSEPPPARAKWAAIAQQAAGGQA